MLFNVVLNICTNTLVPGTYLSRYTATIPLHLLLNDNLHELMLLLSCSACFHDVCLYTCDLKILYTAHTQHKTPPKH